MKTIITIITKGKKVLFLAFFTLGFLTANAQFSLGLKAGANAPTFNTSDVMFSKGERIRYMLGFHGGFMTEFKINDKISLQGELLYSQQGTEVFWDFDGGVTSNYYVQETRTINIDYLNIPIMAKFYATRGLNITGGFQFGFVMTTSGERKTHTTTYPSTGRLENTTTSKYNIDEYIKDFDFGLNVGLGYKLKKGFDFGVRYNLGLSNTSKTKDGSSYRNGVISASLGYFFL